VPNSDVDGDDGDDGDDVMDEDVGAGEERAARWLSRTWRGDSDDATQDTPQIPGRRSLMAMLKTQRSERALVKGSLPRIQNKAQKQYTYALGRTLWIKEQTWATERVYLGDGAVGASN
jgi:hypothetical protein